MTVPVCTSDTFDAAYYYNHHMLASYNKYNYHVFYLNHHVYLLKLQHTSNVSLQETVMAFYTPD